MSNKLFAAFLLMGIICLPVVSIAEEQDCYSCHKDQKTDFAKGKVHDPVAEGDCGSCHEDHGDDNKLVLVDEVPTLCFSCHDELKESHKHEPVAEGSCLDCHQVHNSAMDHLLTKTTPDLCYDCHDPFGDKKSVHRPVAKGDCLDCHTSHESAETGLLSMPTAELCAECHEQSDHSKGKYPHDPVAEGECLECHASHQSDNGNLLSAPYSLERYAPYTAETYALCFNCHEKSAFEDKAAGDETEFRHGDQNLHYLHVFGKEEVNKYGIKKRKEGMTCMGCHISHGTEQPKLIRYNLTCGPTFCYTLNYRKFDGGGSCVVGCHKPKVYKLSPDAAKQGGEPELSPLAQSGSTTKSP